jgi:Flp pilus assembly protein TadD
MAQEWLKSRPNQAGAYVACGWLCARDGDLDNARVRFQRALDLDPQNWRAMAELGQLFERLGRGDRAIVLYQRSLAVNPDQPELRKSLETLRSRGVRPPHPD